VPKRHIVQGLRKDVLDWLVERQKKAVAKYTNKDPRVAAFIILDDVIADQKIIRWNSDLQRFFVEGRHLAITVFIASQYLKGVGPVRLLHLVVRANGDSCLFVRGNTSDLAVPTQSLEWFPTLLQLSHQTRRMLSTFVLAHPPLRR